MKRKSKFSRSRRMTRKLVFKPNNHVQRDIFLKIASQVVSPVDARINSKLERIEFEIHGEYDIVESIMKKLRDIEKQVKDATEPGKGGVYQYSNHLLTRLFKPPISLRILAHALELYGYNAQVNQDLLITSATLEEFKHIHSIIVNLMETAPDGLNKDILRWSIGIAIETENFDLEQILNQSIVVNALKIVDGEYKFGMEPGKARTIVLETSGIQPVINQEPLEEDELANYFFEGGKIVFTKNGEEIDALELNRSFYDGENNNQS